MEAAINDLKDAIRRRGEAGRMSQAEVIKLNLLAIQAEALVKILRHLEQQQASQENAALWRVT